MIEEKNILLNRFWTEAGPCGDSVLSTRVRLARNITGFPFPHRESSAEASYIISLFEKYTGPLRGGHEFFRISGLDKKKKRFLRERNIITLETEISDKSAVFFDEDGDYSVLINEEDHIRIQVVRPGLQLKETFERANTVDDELNVFIPYVFSNDYGYLTACPTNLGTGMKVSAMLHLPALTMKKTIQTLTMKVRSEGAVVSGAIEKNGRAPGSLYQISNKVSLGLSEVDIIELMDGVLSKIIYAEDEARDELLSRSRPELEDLVWRSYGILSAARRMSYSEAMEHLSNIRFGTILAIIKGHSLALVNNLMINIQPAHLEEIFKRSFQASRQDAAVRSVFETDEMRAAFLRMNFSMGHDDDV